MTVVKDEADIARMSMLEQWTTYDADREERIRTLKAENGELRAEIGRMLTAHQAATKFDRFFDGARQYLYDNPSQRRGQAYMNYLCLFDRQSYDMVRNSRYDPWDREELFGNLQTFLRDLWAVSK